MLCLLSINYERLIIAILAFTAGFYGARSVRYKNEIETKYIHIDTLQQRVFRQFGEGGMGVEEMDYLKTGKPIDEEEEEL